MYPELLMYLRCCGDETCRLTVVAGDERAPDGDIVNGTLLCAKHGRCYPIRHGIADFRGWSLPNGPAQFVNDLPPTAWMYERVWRYRALTILTGEPFGYTRELPLVSGLLDPKRPGLYLDIACSNGLYARALAQVRGDASGHVVGIDHALPMLRQARAFARRAGLRISYVRAEAQALPFHDGVAAGVAMGGSLNEIGDEAAALSEWRRVLATDGRGVMMSLVRAESAVGRMIQSAVSPGGVVFLPIAAHNHLLHNAGMRIAAQWRYRVVVFSLLLRATEVGRSISL